MPMTACPQTFCLLCLRHPDSKLSRPPAGTRLVVPLRLLRRPKHPRFPAIAAGIQELNVQDFDLGPICTKRIRLRKDRRLNAACKVSALPASLPTLLCSDDPIGDPFTSTLPQVAQNVMGLIRLMRARCEVLGCGASTNCSEVGMLGKCYW